jgi:hypothetical protein
LERFSVDALDTMALVDEAVATLLIGWGASPAEVKAMRTRARRLVH